MASLTAGQIIGIIIAGAAANEARKSRKERSKASKIQQKQAQLRASRAALEQVRVAQIERARLVQQGAATGTLESSSVQGGLGSIQSQAGANIGFAQALFNLQSQAASRLRRADIFAGNAQALSTAATFSANFDTGSSTPAPVETSVPV